MTMKQPSLDCEQQRLLGNVQLKVSERITPTIAKKVPTGDAPAAGEISDGAASNLAKSLRELAVELMATQRSLSHSAAHFNRLHLHVEAVNRMLKTLEEDGVKNDNSFNPGKGFATSNPSQKLEVCPEKFMGKNLAYGYPFFRKGFENLNCTDFVPMHKLITLLLDVPREQSTPADSYLGILQGVEKYYPKVRVILRTENPIESSALTSISKLDIDFKSEVYPGGTAQGKVWQKLLPQVETPYVLVAPHITHFDDDIDLKRLVRVLSNNDGVMIAGGSYRNMAGHWDIGCQQTSFRNWTVTYKGGYYHSFTECVVCDFMPGPWAAKTKELQELGFDGGSVLLTVGT